MLSSWHRALFILVVALPLLAQAFPTPGAIPIFLPVALLLAPVTLLMRIADKGVPGLLLGDSGFMAIFALTVLIYIYGVVISVDVHDQNLLREIVNGIVAMMVVFSIANSGWTAGERARLVRSMASALLFVGLFVGILGVYKLSLFLSTRETLDFVLVANNGEYPWGTSLLADYNFYSLTVLVAILAALFLANYLRPFGQSILGILIVFLLVVGILAGSRRFWMIAPLIMVVQSLWMVSRCGVRRYSVVFGVLLFCVVGLPAVIYVVANDLFELLFVTAWDFQLRVLTLLNSELAFGMGPRFELWDFAINRLDGFVPWFGNGFDYMHRFSCEFGECAEGGYPHMPILSAYLYGGVIAAVLACVLLVYLTLAGWKLLSHDFEFGWLCFPMLSALLFAAVSGNGSLAIRSYIILGAVCVGFLNAIHADSGSPRESAVLSAA